MTDHKTTVLQSQTGVRQGDPLGPMFFALGIASVLHSVSRDRPLCTILSYHDDTYVVGPMEDTRESIRLIKSRLAPLGLRFNDDKGKIFGSLHNQQNLRLANIPVETEGFIAMGLPVGNHQFILNHLDQLVRGQTRVLELLHKFSSPEAFALLKQCITARPTHCVRGVDPTLTTEYADRFDTEVRLSLATIANIPTGLDDISNRVKNLPAELGGLGMRCLSNIRESAWTSSWLTCLKYIRQHLPRIFDFIHSARYDPAVIDKVMEEEIQQLPPRPPVMIGTATANVVNTPMDQHDVHVVDIVVPLVSNNDNIPSQHKLSSKHDKRRHEQLLDDLRASNRPAAAWLLSSSTKGAASWLYSACSSVAGTQLSHEAFQDGLRSRLLVPPHQDPPGVHVRRRCPTCRDANISPLHALSCRMPSATRTHRHNLVRDAVAIFVRSIHPTAQIFPEYEMVNGRQPPRDGPVVAAAAGPVAGGRGGRGARGARAQEPLRCDLKIEYNGITTYVDVAVANPSSNSALQSANGGSSVVENAVSILKENDKLSKYRNKYTEEVSNRVVPFVVEATGRLGPRASAFIKEWSGIGNDNFPEAAKARALEARPFFLARLAKVLVMGNHLLLQRGRGFYEELPQE
jgi:hypothetical protein